MWKRNWREDTNEIFKDFIGKTCEKIETSEDEMVFHFSDGTKFKLWHCQDCCEWVSIESITGDTKDLLRVPLLVAEERCSEEDTGYGHETWTFYTFRTINGSVDVRWYGESNGYYSESVDISVWEEE